MAGMSSSGKGRIRDLIDEMFDNIAMHLLGEIPKFRKKGKHLIITHQPHYSLPSLFIQALKNKSPNPVESDALKGMLDSAAGYIESLKAKTQSSLAERLDGYVREQHAASEPATEEGVRKIVGEEMEKAKSHLNMIAEAEATKTRNMGSALDILKVGTAVGDADPLVFFVVVRDGALCAECKRLHLMDDKVTPRVWRFSELAHGYHKKGDASPSVCGLHPHCRCTLTYLAKGFGFKDGRVSYIGDEHDEHRHQRD